MAALESGQEMVVGIWRCKEDGGYAPTRHPVNAAAVCKKTLHLKLRRSDALRSIAGILAPEHLFLMRFPWYRARPGRGVSVRMNHGLRSYKDRIGEGRLIRNLAPLQQAMSGKPCYSGCDFHKAEGDERADVTNTEFRRPDGKRSAANGLPVRILGFRR